jgi:hypothetical protein
VHKYTRKYYINDAEVPLDILLKYLEIKLLYDNTPIGELNIMFNDIKEVL